MSKKLGYSVLLYRVLPLNPDGTKVEPLGSGVVGGGGPFNLQSILTANKASLVVKIDGQTSTGECDFTAAVVKTAVTVDEAVVAINTATFADITGITASKTSEGRIKIVSDGIGERFIEVSGELAKALGLERVYVVAKEPKTVKFDPDIETGNSVKATSGRGLVAEIREPDKVKGMKVEITDAEENPLMAVAMVGGSYDIAKKRYLPPMSTDDAKPMFHLETFQALYDGGISQKGGRIGFRMRVFPSCTASPLGGENTEEQFTAGQYSVVSVENRNDSTNPLPAYYYEDLTTVEYAAVEV